MKKYLIIGVVVILISSAGLIVRFYPYEGSGKAEGAAVVLSADPVFSAAPSSKSSTEVSSVPSPVSQLTPQTGQAIEGMRAYSNTAFHFGLLFPDNLHATEYKEQGGSLTASFQYPNTSQGFQVYVTPYSGKQIDAARFKLDEPSGVVQSPIEIQVDDASGIMFFGKNAIMGDTREVWFIHGGFLYEVTTYKELDTWLGGIMRTWKFI